MKEIEQIVTDYLQTEHTDFAIMINGDWGCGKTYFIKKILFDKINNIDSFEEGKKNAKIKYDPLYVSLYGISDINDVLYKVHLELNKWLKSKGWVLARTGISKFTSFFNMNTSKEDEKNILSIFNIKRNRVIFFDDLERIDKNLSLSSILGQINHFTEQDNLKVVIVCNKSKTEEIFDEINEKTVRFSCEYNPNLNDLYDSFIENYKGKYKEFLKAQKSIVLTVFNVAKYKNLRTLRFILDVFEKIYKVVNGQDFHEDILSRFLFFISIYSVEYKNGCSKADLKSIENLGPFSKMFRIDVEKLLMSDSGEESIEEKPTYLNIFKNKYQDIIESFNYSNEIANYVLNGFLDELMLLKEIHEIQKEIKVSRGTVEERLTNKIKNWRALSDDEFLPTLEEVYEIIDQGKFSLVQFILIFAEFLQFEYYGLEGISVTDELIERFKKGIDLSKENHKYIDAFAFKLPIWSNSDTTPAKDKYNVIYQYVIDANDYALSKENAKVSNELIDFLKANNDKALQEFISNHALIGVPIFEHLNENEVFDLLLIADRSTVSAFNWGLYARYPEGDPFAHRSFLKDKDFLCEFQILVEKHIESIKERKISTVQLIELNKNLTRIKKLKV